MVVGEPLPEQVLDTAVDPAAIVQQSFATERRGFDQRQVQQYLRAIADSLQDAQKRETDMRTRLGRAVRRAENAEHALRNAPEHDPAEMNRELGDQVASVLEAARVAGEQRLAAAEKSAGQLMANAKSESTKTRAEADVVLQQRSTEAELAATDIQAAAQAEAQGIRDQARTDADVLLAEAAARVERARNECDGLIREAEEARAQILEDMERRRRQARAQVERLRVGRDRLLRSYEVVRRTLEETTVELKSSLKEAKVRGDGAARAITSEPLASRDQLEAELRDAKMIGRITISDPAPTQERLTAAGVLRSPALPRPLNPGQPSGQRPPRVSEAMKKGALASNPQAPASAPALKASSVADADEDPIAAMMAAAEEKRLGTAAPVPADLSAVDEELAELEDGDLAVVEPSDDIEEVVAVPVAKAADTESPGLFDALRAQRADRRRSRRATKTESTKAARQAETEALESAVDQPDEEVIDAESVVDQPDEEVVDAESVVDDDQRDEGVIDAASVVDQPDEGVIDAESVLDDDQPDEEVVDAEPVVDQPDEEVVDAESVVDQGGETSSSLVGIEAQRDAVIADAAKQIEKRLKRALADEQNEILSGLRAAKKNVALTAMVGDVDVHINRYVLAIHEVAAMTYGAGAALVDVEASQGHLPAGAVEELLEADVVSPIRQRLASLDELDVDAAAMHVDPVRAFYRQRKIDYLGPAASRLASLLCVAGLCDALPEESSLPWEPASK